MFQPISLEKSLNGTNFIQHSFYYFHTNVIKDTKFLNRLFFNGDTLFFITLVKV